VTGNQLEEQLHGPLKDGVVTTKVTTKPYFLSANSGHVELRDESSLGHAAVGHVAHW